MGTLGFGLGLYGMIVLAGFALWIFSLINACTSNFTGSNKIIWILLIIFIPFLGSILYLLIGRGQRVQTLNQVKDRLANTSSQQSGIYNYCTQCGTKNQDIARFCNNCGIEIQDGFKSEVQQNNMLKDMLKNVCSAETTSLPIVNPNMLLKPGLRIIGPILVFAVLFSIFSLNIIGKGPSALAISKIVACRFDGHRPYVYNVSCQDNNENSAGSFECEYKIVGQKLNNTDSFCKFYEWEFDPKIRHW
jgi:hypothetical protein